MKKFSLSHDFERHLAIAISLFIWVYGIVSVATANQHEAPELQQQKQEFQMKLSEQRRIVNAQQSEQKKAREDARKAFKIANHKKRTQEAKRCIVPKYGNMTISSIPLNNHCMAERVLPKKEQKIKTEKVEHDYEKNLEEKKITYPRNYKSWIQPRSHDKIIWVHESALILEKSEKTAKEQVVTKKNEKPIPLQEEIVSEVSTEDNTIINDSSSMSEQSESKIVQKEIKEETSLDELFIQEWKSFVKKNKALFVEYSDLLITMDISPETKKKVDDIMAWFVSQEDKVQAKKDIMEAWNHLDKLFLAWELTDQDFYIYSKVQFLSFE